MAVIRLPRASRLVIPALVASILSMQRHRLPDSFDQVILDLKRWVNAILPAVTKR